MKTKLLLSGMAAAVLVACGGSDDNTTATTPPPAAVTSISGTAAVGAALATTWLVPVMTKTSFAPIFILGAALVPLSLLCIWLGGRIEPVQPRTEN